MRLFIFLSLFLGLASTGIVLKDEVPTRKELAKYLYSITENDAATSCDACTLLVDSIQTLIKQGKDEDYIFNFVRTACKNLHIDEAMPHVCDHIIKIFGDELIFVMNHTNYQPKDLCNTFVSGCGSDNNPVNAIWNMTIPGNKPPVKPWPTVPSGKPTLRVLHLSDIHIDSNYTVGSEADCTYEWFSLCCRTDLATRAKRDVRATKLPSGEWGMANHCDIPQKTFEHAIRHIAATEKNLDYIIITGDLEAHDMWEYSHEYTQGRINYVNNFLKEQFGSVPIYNSIGNHEGVPGDAMAPHKMVEYDQRGPAWLYSSLADSWKMWLPDDTLDSIKYRASYVIKPYPGLKLISINTIYCSHFNFYLYLDFTDPDETLQWLIGHLLDSEGKGEKVHIISHIPVGSNYCLKGWAHNFYDIVNRFENTIAGQYYGHTHQDHFQVFYENGDPKGRPTHVNLIGPSLTTYAYNNPAYRIYTIDGNYPDSTFTTIDYETYYTNLTEANENGEPTWKFEYKMKDAYNMPDLSPASFDDVINRMETNETLFEQYFIFYHRNDKYKMSCIKEASCRKSYACACRSARSYDRDHFCPKSNI